MSTSDSAAAGVQELDPSVPVERLAHLIKHASELQVRLCMWRVTSASDFDALAKDVRGLEADLHDLTEEIKYGRGKIGVDR